MKEFRTAVLLFGGLARGEVAAGSDIDVLVIDDGQDVRHSRRGKLSVFNYPWATLLEGAARGDLFACHVAFEAQAIVDPDDRLATLRGAFSFKRSYAKEIAQATDLGWFLVRHGGALDAVTVARRVVWCVRTILIARSAEAREPVFSPTILAKRSRSKPARELLRLRHAHSADAVMLRRLQLFLTKEAPTEPFHLRASFVEFVDRFRATRNSTASATAEAIPKNRDGYA